MRNSMGEALRESLQGFVDAGLPVTFTKKQLNQLGVEVKDVACDAQQIQQIRKKMHLSQDIFAKVLNVSTSAVRQWEQGKRTPTGSTKVLLDLLEQNPHLLDYRIQA